MKCCDKHCSRCVLTDTTQIEGRGTDQIKEGTSAKVQTLGSTNKKNLIHALNCVSKGWSLSNIKNIEQKNPMRLRKLYCEESSTASLKVGRGETTAFLLEYS